jgi:hypothetical protein
VVRRRSAIRMSAELGLPYEMRLVRLCWRGLRRHRVCRPLNADLGRPFGGAIEEHVANDDNSACAKDEGHHIPTAIGAAHVVCARFACQDGSLFSRVVRVFLVRQCFCPYSRPRTQPFLGLAFQFVEAGAIRFELIESLHSDSQRSFSGGALSAADLELRDVQSFLFQTQSGAANYLVQVFAKDAFRQIHRTPLF